MSVEDTSIYGAEVPPSNHIEPLSFENNIYGNVGFPSGYIEPCTKTITGEIEEPSIEDISVYGEDKVPLDTNLILIILSILFIVFFLCWD